MHFNKKNGSNIDCPCDFIYANTQLVERIIVTTPGIKTKVTINLSSNMTVLNG
jgi:hypothetical protein